MLAHRPADAPKNTLFASVLQNLMIFLEPCNAPHFISEGFSILLFSIFSNIKNIPCGRLGICCSGKMNLN
jgi:hypothetical protein